MATCSPRQGVGVTRLLRQGLQGLNKDEQESETGPGLHKNQ